MESRFCLGNDIFLIVLKFKHFVNIRLQRFKIYDNSPKAYPTIDMIHLIRPQYEKFFEILPEIINHMPLAHSLPAKTFDLGFEMTATAHIDMFRVEYDGPVLTLKNTKREMVLDEQILHSIQHRLEKIRAAIDAMKSQIEATKENTENGEILYLEFIEIIFDEFCTYNGKSFNSPKNESCEEKINLQKKWKSFYDEKETEISQVFQQVAYLNFFDDELIDVLDVTPTYLAKYKDFDSFKTPEARKPAEKRGSTSDDASRNMMKKLVKKSLF